MKTSTTQKQNGTKKINRISVVDQVCESLKHDISSHRWIAGDKIPSEGELADAFGVNRLSVRMALQKLNTLGIIETRVGEGSFVTDFSLKPMLMEVAPFYEGDKKYRDIQHMRLLLETDLPEKRDTDIPQGRDAADEAQREFDELTTSLKAALEGVLALRGHHTESSIDSASLELLD